MNFRLVVKGHLPSDKRGTVDAKHRIRRELHPQLRTLWKQRPALHFGPVAGPDPRHPPHDKLSRVERIANHHSLAGFRFVPLIREIEGWVCALDVLLLRRDEPHKVFSGAGDLDGRVKTLIDALRIPHQSQEVRDQTPANDEDPFFCLLEDDKFVREFAVTTDVLLVPPDEGESPKDVFAVIRVSVTTVEGHDPFAITA